MQAAAQRSLQVFPAGSNGEFNLPPELCTVIARGEGTRAWDVDGKEYLDFCAGWAVNNLGHCDHAITQAIV